ncbi:DinB family protein [Pedobacter riviphilus]|uniref:DinB family protein n=1 Tax=Pedobacter riviphilus TaxID=2766984 RepID=A0ABX6TIY3_9SPHI|nr:DinB family protein [Pedobacter riviphilus]QNR84365.1 DinB family protein [Pedobacter riviphilus]
MIEPKPFVKWFDRKFDTNIDIVQFEDVLSRMEHFPAVLNQLLETYPKKITTIKTGAKWSVNENVGHLILLEDLWRRRFQDIKDGKPDMSPADLNNTATDQASFNEQVLNELTKSLSDERAKTIVLLKGISKEDLLKKSTHPRLNQPMNIVDFMYFVAGHDEHHMAAMRSIIENLEHLPIADF